MTGVQTTRQTAVGGGERDSRSSTRASPGVQSSERTVLVRFATEVIDPQQNIDREKTKRDAEGRTHYVAVPPLAITFNIKTKEGTAMKETVYCTINGLESVE